MEFDTHFIILHKKNLSTSEYYVKLHENGKTTDIPVYKVGNNTFKAVRPN